MDTLSSSVASRSGREGTRAWLREVVTDQNAPRSPAQIGRLLEIASSQDEAWAQLDGCLRRLREIRRAQQTLATLSPAERAAALESRRQQLRGDLA